MTSNAIAAGASQFGSVSVSFEALTKRGQVTVLRGVLQVQSNIADRWAIDKRQSIDGLLAHVLLFFLGRNISVGKQILPQFPVEILTVATQPFQHH